MRIKNKEDNILYIPEGKKVYMLTKDFKIHILENGAYKLNKSLMIDTSYNHLCFNAAIERIGYFLQKENNIKKLTRFISDIKFKKFDIKSNDKNPENKDTTVEINSISHIVSNKFGITAEDAIDDLNIYFKDDGKYISTKEVDNPFEESLNILKDFKLTDDLMIKREWRKRIVTTYLLYKFLLMKDILDVMIKNENPGYFTSQYEAIHNSVEDFRKEMIKMSTIKV